MEDNWIVWLFHPHVTINPLELARALQLHMFWWAFLVWCFLFARGTLDISPWLKMNPIIISNNVIVMFFMIRVRVSDGQGTRCKCVVLFHYFPPQQSHFLTPGPSTHLNHATQVMPGGKMWYLKNLERTMGKMEEEHQDPECSTAQHLTFIKETRPLRRCSHRGSY